MKRHSLAKSEFSRNVLTLMVGTTIAQAVPIAVIPILTRLYTPEDFGLLALFISITAILGSIANAKYELAIVLPEKDDDAINIAALGLIIVSCLSFVLLIIVVAFNNKIGSLLGNEQIKFWLYFVPLSVWLTGIFNVIAYLNIRKKRYKDLAIANVYKSTASVTIQLGLGFIKYGAAGLISGQIAAQLVANFRLFRNTLQHYNLTIISRNSMGRMSIIYANFPKYSMSAALVNVSANHMVSFFIPLAFNLSTLGYFSIVKKVLSAPSSLIGEAVSQVFYQDLTERQHDKIAFKNSFYKMLYRLVIASTLIFIPVYYLIIDVFGLVLGEDWLIAGEYARLMTIMIAIQFIVSPLTRVNQILLKNKAILIWQVYLLLTYILVLGSAYFLEWEFVATLKTLVFFVSVCYLIYLLVIIRFVNNAAK